MKNIRCFAATLLVSLVVVGSPLLGHSQDVPAFKLHDLGNGAWMAADNADAKAARSGSNAGFVVGDSGVVVVDTFENTAAADALLKAIQAKTTLPVRFVVNTHYHLDHVAGNSVFAAAGATVMAQDNVRYWERTENLKFFGDQIKPEEKQFVQTLGLPSVTYATGATLFLSTVNQEPRRVVLRAMPGHTGGDTVVYDQTANVVFCGDLFWNHTLPNLIDASTKPWVETLDTLLAEYPTATFVPGHGDEPGKAADVKAFRDYLVFLRQAVAAAQADKLTGDAVVAKVLPQLKEKYGSWAFFDFAKPDIQRTDEELRGVKHLPVPNKLP